MDLEWINILYCWCDDIANNVNTYATIFGTTLQWSTMKFIKIQKRNNSVTFITQNLMKNFVQGFEQK